MGKSIGIDLGTTNSVVAYFNGNGAPQVLRTRENETLTPSVVSYSAPSTRKDGQSTPGTILVGRAAVRNAQVAPEDTIFSVKRLMGRTVDEEKVQEAQQQFGYRLADIGAAHDRGIRIHLGENTYTPIQVSAMILRQLKEDAERALGAEVTHAVITVPAYFEERQRDATLKAGVEAGLIVKQIIDEPIASAVAFGMDRPQERHIVLVYDMGGGTFDLTLVQMTNHKLHTLALEGDMWLGGDNFDYEIVKAIQTWIQQEHGIDPLLEHGFRAIAKQEAEKAKIALGGQPEVRMLYPGIVQEPLIRLDMTVSRQEFEGWIKGHVEHSMELVRKILRHQNLGPDDLTAVLLVGGATATPLVYEAVSRFFGPEKVLRSVDPMHCVAIGASILAYQIDSIECPYCSATNPEDAATCKNCGRTIGKKIIWTPSTARSVGIAVVKDRNPDAYSVVIPKGTRYPLSHPIERTYAATSSEVIRIAIYEGENPIASQNERQGYLEYRLSRPIEVGTLITVSMDYDKNRVLKVGVWVTDQPDLKKEVVLDRTGPLGPAPIGPAKKSWSEELEKTVRMARDFLDQYGTFIDEGLAVKMEDDIEKAQEALASGKQREGERVMKALDTVIFGETTASLLFMANHIIARVPQPHSAMIRQTVFELKEAAGEQDQERSVKASEKLSILLRQGRMLMGKSTTPPPLPDRTGDDIPEEP